MLLSCAMHVLMGGDSRLDDKMRRPDGGISIAMKCQGYG
jgi:hypothetical protein